MARVFVDTNVLFPFSVMDLMLTLTEDGVHDLIWTESLLAEWERVIVHERGRSAESAARIASAIREYFQDGFVAEKDYVGLIGSMTGPDPDDRRHMAAAVAGRAEAIITWNRKDFPSNDLGRLGIRVLDPDEYLVELLDQVPEEMVRCVVRMARRKRRPPMSPSDVVDRLAKAGVIRFARALGDKALRVDPG